MWQAQDIEELENEVEDLESLAKELKLGSFLDLDQRPPPRAKGGKRKKKQAKVNSKSKGGGGGGGAVTLCQLMNICDSLPLGELHCNENPIYVFLFWELPGLSPDFHIYVTVSYLYITIDPRIFLQQNRQTDPGKI